MWDRRTLDASGRRSRPAGVFVGHTEGVTHLDSKVGRLPGLGWLRVCRCYSALHDRAQPAWSDQLGLVQNLCLMFCAGEQGDGRYVISNSKDQSIKLWDTR